MCLPKKDVPRSAVLFAIIVLIVSCSGGEGFSSVSEDAGDGASGVDTGFQSGPPLDADVSRIERMSNGFDFDSIHSLWVCSTANSTRGYGLVFLTEAERDRPNGGFLYLPDGGVQAFLWYSYMAEENGHYRLLVSGGSFTNSQLELPEFTSPDVFTSTNVNFTRVDYGPTTCIREAYSRPVQL